MDKNIFVFGISHSTAPITVREQFSLSSKESSQLLEYLLKENFLSEGVVLSTCNRTEIYGVCDNFSNIKAIGDKFFEIKKTHKSVFDSDYFFTLKDYEAILHLFKVATGADSMVLGESEILGQLKKAYHESQENKHLGKALNRLIQSAIASAKRVTSETNFHKRAVSVSFAAVELARKIFSDLSSKEILLVGTGSTGELVAKYLLDKNAKHISITNRTISHAEDLAKKIQAANVLAFDSFKSSLKNFDIVISAVADIGHVISMTDILSALQKRNFQPTLFLDLGLPRNIEPSSSNIYGVFLKSIDDLQSIIQKNISERQLELPNVHKILQEEVIDFMVWQKSLEAVPVIKALTKQFEAIKQSELSHFKGKVDEKTFDIISSLANRLIKKAIHHPIQTLRQGNIDAEVIQQIYSIKQDGYTNNKRNL